MPPYPALPLADLHILVVDDQWLLACEVASTLEALGAEVTGLVGRIAGFEALIWRERPLDGAVLDVQLGAEQVYPLADALIACGVPVLLATHGAVELLPERFRALPRVDKPLPPRRELGQAAAQAFGPDRRS
jgi:CheY-like chemotaxis protein